MKKRGSASAVFAAVMMVSLALGISCKPARADEPPPYIACRMGATHLDALRQKELKKRLTKDDIRTVALCNYRTVAEVFVELSADPQAPENAQMYKVLYAQLLGIVRKDIVLIDLKDALKISLTMKKGAAQAEYQILAP